MPFWLHRVFYLMREHISHITWPALAGLVLLHAGLIYLMLHLIGEQELITSWQQYLYFYFITISTVGYGDFSPTSELGMLLIALLLVVPGLGLFGAILGKLVTTLSYFTKRTMQGMKSYPELEDHIVIFGWNPLRTRRIVELILGDKKRKPRPIVLAVTDNMEHPMADLELLRFVRLESYTEPAQLERSGVHNASKVIIDGENDEQTLTIALGVGSYLNHGHSCHISAFFEDETKARLIGHHVPNIECSTSRAAEVLARTMQDPGSSRLLDQLLDTLHGATQFSLDVPGDTGPLHFKVLFEHLKYHHQATVLAVASSRHSHGLIINPPPEHPVHGGQVLYYISDARLYPEEVDWHVLKEATE